MRDNIHGRRLEDSVELEVFRVVDNFASSETITDGLDYEVPDDREEEDLTGWLMVTVYVSFGVRSFPCEVRGEGLVDKAGLKQHMNWHHCFLVAVEKMPSLQIQVHLRNSHLVLF